MRPNDIVWIFEDPLTHQKLEGSAWLVEELIPGPDSENGLAFWRVRFTNEPATTYDRWIAISQPAIDWSNAEFRKHTFGVIEGIGRTRHLAQGRINDADFFAGALAAMTALGMPGSLYPASWTLGLVFANKSPLRPEPVPAPMTQATRRKENKQKREAIQSWLANWPEHARFSSLRVQHGVKFGDKPQRITLRFISLELRKLLAAGEIEVVDNDGRRPIYMKCPKAHDDDQIA